MPAKTPIYLKSGGGKNGQANGKGGKKLRELLSTDMISPPLGDFRHMAHVGRGGAGDMFGDTSFLQKKLAASENVTSQQNDDSVPKVVAEGLATMRRNGSLPKKVKKKQRNLSTPDENSVKADVKSLSTQSYDGYGPMESPILQSAFSLPLLNQQSTSSPSSPTSDDGKKSKSKKTMNNNCISNGKTRSHETGLDNIPITSTPNVVVDGPPKPRRIMSDGDDSALGNGNHVVGNGMPTDKLSPLRRSSEVYTQKPDGLLPAVAYSDNTSLSEGWELDLGASLMDDVMGIMDRIEL